jgi:hypothetical protein
LRIERGWVAFRALLGTSLLKSSQVGRAHSLREICGGLAGCEGQLKHFGSEVERAEALRHLAQKIGNRYEDRQA